MWPEIISNIVEPLHKESLYNEVSGLIKNNSPQPGRSCSEIYSCMEQNQGQTNPSINIKKC